MEQWAELRREHFPRGVEIKELVRRTGLSRNTVRAALRSSEPPRYSRSSAGSKLDPFKDEIHRLLGPDPKLSGQRVRELIVPLGFEGGKTIVDDYLREVRPLLAPPPRPFQRTVFDRASCASSTCGSRATRCRSGMVRRARPLWLSPAWATRGRAPAR